MTGSSEVCVARRPESEAGHQTFAENAVRVPVSPARINSLDALRGVAAVAVLIQHIMEQIINSQSLPTFIDGLARFFFMTSFNFGRFGVALFFLISGFVIPFSLKGKRPLRTFAVSRIFRLYPAYWLSLLFALAVIWAMNPSTPPAMAVIANATMFQRFVGQPDLVGSYWTLAIELAFYFLCAGLAAIGMLRNPTTLTVSIVALLGLATALGIASTLFDRHLPSGVPMHLSIMLLGTLARAGWLERDATARRLVVLLAPLFIFLIPIIRFLSYPDGTANNAFVQPSAFTFAYYAAAALFFLCVVRRLNFGGVAVWFGAISYSVYLFHGPILSLVHGVLLPGSEAHAFLYATLGITGTIAISATVFYLVETPCIRLGHSLVTRLGGQSADAGSALAHSARRADKGAVYVS